MKKLTIIPYIISIIISVIIISFVASSDSLGTFIYGLLGTNILVDILCIIKLKNDNYKKYGGLLSIVSLLFLFGSVPSSSTIFREIYEVFYFFQLGLSLTIVSLFLKILFLGKDWNNTYPNQN